MSSIVESSRRREIDVAPFFQLFLFVCLRTLDLWLHEYRQEQRRIQKLSDLEQGLLRASLVPTTKSQNINFLPCAGELHHGTSAALPAC